MTSVGNDNRLCVPSYQFGINTRRLIPKPTAFCSKERYNMQRSGKGAIRKKFLLQKSRWKTLNWQLVTYTYKTFRKPSEQLFPNRRPLRDLHFKACVLPIKHILWTDAFWFCLHCVNWLFLFECFDNLHVDLLLFFCRDKIPTRLLGLLIVKI